MRAVVDDTRSLSTDASVLIIVILVAGYVVLVLSVFWARHWRDDKERYIRVKHDAYMAEVRRHCREQDEAG